jgi:hypothetical protein
VNASPPSRARRWARGLWVYAAPLVLPWVILGAVVVAPPSVFPRRAIPREAYRADRCTWYCHNHECRHRPVLPAALAGDRGLYGATIRGLFRAGSALSGDRARGYGAANLLLFCVAWPGLMYGLWVRAWRPRRKGVT